MPRTSTAERLDPALRKLLAIVILGTIAPLLDTTIINVAIDTLGRDLNASVSTIQWVNTGYLLALGMLIPPSGWAVARFGAKRMWLFSLLVFLAGSVLAGASWDIGSLIFFRVVQGIGGGLMFPIMQTIVVQAAGGRRVGRLMALVGLPAVLVPILGPVIGGLIISNLSWRWIFYVNVPICLLALVLAWRGMTDTAPRGRRPLDVVGLALLSPGLAALLYALSQAGSHGGFGSPAVLVALAVGVVLVVGFALHALYVSKEPVVDLRLFRLPSFTAAGTLLFLSGLALYGAMLLLPLYYQQVRGLSALEAGLMLAPQGVGSLLTRGPVGTLVDRVGPRPIVLVGMVLATLGTWVFTQAGEHPNDLLLAASLVVRGAGLSAATVAVMAAAYIGLPAEKVPHASSATRILQQVGGAFGSAVLAVLLQQQLAMHVADSSGRVAAFNTTFWWALGFTAFAIIPALFMAKKPAAAPSPAPAEDAGAESSSA